MRISILIIGLFFGACGDSGGIYEGKLYTGQVLLSEGTDISDFSFSKLSAPSAVKLATEIGVLENDEELQQINAWESAVFKEINNAPESERLSKKLQYMCDYMEFIDLDFVRLYTETQSLKILLSNPTTAAPAEYHAKIYHKMMPAITYFFEITTKRRKPIPIDQQKQTHEFLKANCPKYNKIMELVERSPLIKMEGQVESYADVDVIKEFLVRADKAVKPLPVEQKAEVYADVVCQVLSRNPLIMLRTEEDLFDKELQYITSLLELEDAIFYRRLKRLGIASNLEEKRKFNKILAKTCPTYSAWVDYKQEQAFIGGIIAAEKFGMEGVKEMKYETTFDAPDVSFDNFKELKFHMISMDSIWEKKQKESSTAEIVEWATNETCKLIEGLDLDYANNSNFSAWQSIAKINYKFGVERPEDVKILLYDQLLAYYNNLIKTGRLYNIKYKNGDYGFFLGWRVEWKFKEQLQKQCQKQQGKLSEICEKKYLKMDRELFGY